MNEFYKDGYVDVEITPDKYDTYLVKTKEGCYDFAHYNGEGWRKGDMTDGKPILWREIPTTED